MSITTFFTCGREPEYPRNAVIIKALRQNYDVIEITDHSSWILLRYLILISKLLISTTKHHDLIFVGFHGQILIFFARLFSRKPIILDAFSSIYDTYCFDRKSFSPNSIFGKLSFWLDKTSAQIADFVCLDTHAHAQYYHNTFDLPLEKLKVFPVGCDDAIFYPQLEIPIEPLVLYFGNYLPLQGMDVIINAAKSLEGISSLKFLLIGNGIEYIRIRELAKKMALTNVEFLPPVPIIEMPKYISRAMICLGGHFGNSEKAKRVIAGKTYLCLACAKPTIVGDNPANRELLVHGYDAWFCLMNDSEALANSILTLEKDVELRKVIANNARQTFIKKCSTQKISSDIKNIIDQVIAKN